jgi:hypothetical protein
VVRKEFQSKISNRLAALENLNDGKDIKRSWGDTEIGNRGKLHNEELNDMYCSPNIIQMIKSRRKMGGACSSYGGKGWCIHSFGGET